MDRVWKAVYGDTRCALRRTVEDVDNAVQYAVECSVRQGPRRVIFNLGGYTPVMGDVRLDALRRAVQEARHE
ncbi:MAG: hypothetical protein LBT97_03165 [Planctomycetota bacterium]|jgi:hypothetical protein|nr:hypothetical protein [Planctomycetota bacterium]